MFRPSFRSFILDRFVPNRSCFCLFLAFVFSVFPALGKKVTPSIIVASIEGEVSSLNMVDDFKVQMGPTSVGKKVNPKTMLTTGKTGKVALLFSNGTLITIKPGSRFYLRTYKQLEGIVAGTIDPGKLEEEPTQSELSAHLDYGNLVVKAPKLKKGSSMKLTSPLGTAGIRGTMFQLMAVRNSVTGDIMGGINLISGDIDFTDTGGTVVSLLSGQSIQLATSKLGAPVASQTGELVDLSSTYGPALTDGFTPPPLASVFSGYSEFADSNDFETSDNDMFPTMPNSVPLSTTVGNSAGGWEEIHELATDLFFEIEMAETVAADFSFEDMTMAPTVDIPTPQPSAPTVPSSVTGETLAGGDIEFFQGGHPELQLLGQNNNTDPLVKVYSNGGRMEVEMRAPAEGITWRKIDPWVKALDFLGNDLTSGVQINGAPQILLANANTAESEAPPRGQSQSYEVSYSIRDLRGLNTVIFRQVDVIATRPTIQITNLAPEFPWNELDLDKDGKAFDSFFKWLDDHVLVQDVRGESILYDESQNPNSFYLSGNYNLSAIGTYNEIKIVVIDWRGLRTESNPFVINVTSPENLPVLTSVPFVSSFPALAQQGNILEYGDPEDEFENWLNSASAVDSSGNLVTVSPKVLNSELDPVLISDIWPEGGDYNYTIVFEAIDPRWEQGGSDLSLKNQLTTIQTYPLRVFATPPKLELIFHNPRDGLGVSPDFDKITYLVRSKFNTSNFPDDGPFQISADSGEASRQDGDVYYKATAYNGYGLDITSLVAVENVDQVDDETLNDDTTLTISVDDQSIRGLSQGAISTLNTKIDIVDVLSPQLSTSHEVISLGANKYVVSTDGQVTVQGIMPKVAKLSGDSKDQLTGHASDTYYFPDPGLTITDNYYNETELKATNGIIDNLNYTFNYTNLDDFSDESGKIDINASEFGSEKTLTNLDMKKIGDYSITYSLSDDSGNVASINRSITVKDEISPVVKLYGSKTMYVDLQSIADGESRFDDPGAFGIEDLYTQNDGFFDWATIEDDGVLWEYEIQTCNNLEANTYGDRNIADRDFIKSTIEGLVDNPPSQVLRFKFHYILKDRAGNKGEATRTIEIRGSPNLYPTIFFVLDHPDALDGIPSSNSIDSNQSKATLPTLIWNIEVGQEQYSSRPTAKVFTDLGGGQEEDLNNLYKVNKIELDIGDVIKSDFLILASDDMTNFFSKVNFWNNVDEYFVTGEPAAYTKYPKSNTTDWRRVVLRYTVENSLGNKSERDIEVRLVDTTSPTIVKNNFDSGTLEVGDPFTDPGVTISDIAGSLIDSNITIDLAHPNGTDHNATFIELAELGFWEPGDFTITYTAGDEFGNLAETQVLNLTIQDGTDPHVALITHDSLNKFNAPGTGLGSSDLSYQNANNPLVSPNSRFENYEGLKSKLSNLSVHYDNFIFSSEDPYVMQNGNSGFLLKASELDPDFLATLKNSPQNLVSSTSDTVAITDTFGRTFSWYSPFAVKFNDGTTLQDPGFLIYEASNSGLNYEASIAPDWYGADKNQTKEIVVNFTVTQLNTSSRRTIFTNARTYTFLDDIKPLITISPDTDSNSTFIVLEAGSNYNDATSSGNSFRIFKNGNFEPEEILNVRADDVTDGLITSSIVRTITDLNDSGIGSVVTSYPHVNHIYKIEYNVNDLEGNAADPVFRYLIIKDTIAPLIYPQADGNTSDDFLINYLSSSPNPNILTEIQAHLLSGLVASDYGALGAGVSDTIDSSLDPIANSNKWQVTITKPLTDSIDPSGGYDLGKVYPFAKDDPAYEVLVTVTDEFGNVSAPRSRSLKIGDFQSPEVGLIGDTTVHDFLRFSTNTGISPQSDTEEISGNDYNRTGFGAGMHRIMLDNYTFVDPGAYAHDYNSYFSVADGYKNLQGNDAYGETYAMRRVEDRAEMEACAEIGVIYVYSALNNEVLSDPFLHYQGLMKDNIYGSDTNVTITPAANVKVPDVNGSNYTFDEANKLNGISMDVVTITNEYRVKDGWNNKSDIVTRTIYIYESRQFPGYAFYATPLTNGDGLPFEHMYDDGTENRAFLNDTRKDTDGDGVSDFWEKTFGSNPEDRSSVPIQDLSNPSVYNSIDFNISNAE